MFSNFECCCDFNGKPNALNSTPAQRPTRTRPLAVYVFVLALLCQLAMPFTHALAALSNPDADAAIESIVVCTPNGLITQRINLNTNQPVLPVAFPKACEFCHMCPLGSHVIGPLTALQTFAFLPSAPVTFKHIDTSAHHKQAFFNDHHPARAPPVLI